MPHTYLPRFDIEHMFRFAKNTLGWTTPALRTPGQADRWSWLSLLSPSCDWPEVSKTCDFPGSGPAIPPCSPRRGCDRGFGDFVQSSAPRLVHRNSRTPGPGRPKGTRKPPRTRYPAVKKAA